MDIGETAFFKIRKVGFFHISFMLELLVFLAVYW
jgi:hypothetical protein